MITFCLQVNISTFLFCSFLKFLSLSCSPLTSCSTWQLSATLCPSPPCLSLWPSSSTLGNGFAFIFQSCINDAITINYPAVPSFKSHSWLLSKTDLTGIHRWCSLSRRLPLISTLFPVSKSFVVLACKQEWFGTNRRLKETLKDPLQWKMLFLTWPFSDDGGPT